MPNNEVNDSVPSSEASRRPEGNPGPSGDFNQTGRSGFNRIFNHMSNNKIESALFITRLFTIFFALSYLIPISSKTHSYYEKCLLSNAITSALRLHQRLPNFQLSREFFSLLFLEDSGQYLTYSLIFLSAGPVSMVLVPLFLYAFLHAENYTKQLLNLIGPNTLPFLRNLFLQVEQNQSLILRFIATIEIFLMPIIIICVLIGQTSWFHPILYYRFLSLRYLSRRNDHHRRTFGELRILSEQFISKPQCPTLVRTMVTKSIELINKLAPN